ncbi:MAG: hypothetical protein ACK4XJ_05105 [Fimbriimonadaceae bacterium]
MTEQTYLLIKLTVGVIATVGLYSILYRENKFYRLMEHIFVGLAVGWAAVAFWTETLKGVWWDKMVGTGPSNGQPGTPGFWAYAILLPIGLMGYMVFNKKHSWMSRVPIGIILGLWSGQQVQVWWQRYGSQIRDSMKPIYPTTTESFFVPKGGELTNAQVAQIANEVYPSQAISNLIFVITLLCVMSYFLFSFEIKSKLLKGMTNTGRVAMMVGFGAIFGSTVMTRFALLIDRMYFVWIEWLRDAVINGLFRGGG